MNEFIKVGVICSSISLAVTAFAACDIAAQAIKQTALLTRIAVAEEQIATNTKQPVAIEVSGFSPEAQAVFNKAVTPKQKGK